MISVIIPTYNRSAILMQTLRLLFAQDHPRDQYEVVVVDNASTDGTNKQLSETAREATCRFRYFRIEPNNLSRARNTGIREAMGDVVLIMGDDILPEPFLVSQHARFHAAHPEPNCGCLSQVSQLHFPGETPFQHFFDPFGFRLLSGHVELNYLYFWTNNISVKRSFLLENGLFDEEFIGANHEDVELGYRLEKRGFRLFYDERLTGHHHHPQTFADACRQQYNRGLTYPLAERKVPERAYRERISIFSWHNSPRLVVRHLLRDALFNRFTVAHWQAYLESRQRRSLLADFLYWKVLGYYTMAGYREACSSGVRRESLR